MSIETQLNNQVADDDGTVAAKQAAEQATAQAKEFAANAATAVKALDSNRLSYVIALSVVVLFTLIFDMPSFSVGSDGPVTPTQAQAERDVEATLNAYSYSAFSSRFWGKSCGLEQSAELESLSGQQ